MQDRQESDVLQPSLDRTDEGPVHTHARGDRLLAEARCQSIDTYVGAEYPANVHPQDRRQSRILALRTIIRGQICWRSDVSMLLCRSGCSGFYDALGEHGS